MESIQRSVMMLKSDSALHMDHKNQAVLKLQTTLKGLAVDLSAPFLPAQDFGLYLFDKDGHERFAGEIKQGMLQTTLSGMALQAVAGAAVIDRSTLVFYLKSTGPNWTDIAARFKFANTAPPPMPKADEPMPEVKELPSEPDDILSESEEIPPETGEPPVIEETEAEIPNEDTEETPNTDVPGVCDTCPHVIRQDRINPFPSAFPNSEWVKISYPGPTGWWHYISGKIRSGDTVVAKVLGVPGEYGMAPPIWLEGFGTYMRCVTPDAGGYWLMFQDAETGEVLDMGLSPRGE
jgi:hypothetical protein